VTLGLGAVVTLGLGMFVVSQVGISRGVGLAPVAGLACGGLTPGAVDDCC
jgi:hypothetical protein